MNALSRSRPVLLPPLITWTQITAIFAVCANLFSTALANVAFSLLLLLFVCICLSGQRRHLDTMNFPLGVALAIGLYIGWQIVGLSYTEAPMSYAWQSVFADRKILYILPLVLIFSDEIPKKKFFVAFLATSLMGLFLSFAVINPYLHGQLRLNPPAVFRSHATQGMVFAVCVFLAPWFGSRQQRPAYRWGLYGLAGAFFLNLATVTPSRSGYVVFLVLTVWAFSMWRGFKGVAIGVLVASILGVGVFYASSSVRSRVLEGVSEARSYETSPHETSLGRRMVQYETTWGMIKASPVFGAGTGGYKKQFSEIAEQKYTGWRAVPFDDPHNQYLFILAENGVVGLLTFLAMIGTILRYCLKSGSIYGKMAAGCVLAWCATSLFSGHFRTFPEGHLIAFIVGILMVSRAPAGQQMMPAVPEGVAASSR